MTKKELEAENARLTEENAGLRDLLAAVQAMADAPRPASYTDRYYWACTDRLRTIAVWAELNGNAAGPDAAGVMHAWAKSVREKAARPVRYEVYAEPEPEQTFGLCPVNHPNGVHGCTLKPGHDGPHRSVEPLSGRVRNEWADTPASVAS